MADDKIEQLVKEGRRFLHDISNKVLIGSGLGSHVLASLKKGKEADEKMLDKLERSMNALNLIADMIKEHRSYLISLLEETPSGTSSGRTGNGSESPPAAGTPSSSGT
ncbi:MAG: hypothetical protein HQK53_13860 [Oligoflexia bacterium]|nr:hypothetical protein [Oligoflexia bacterium]